MLHLKYQGSKPRAMVSDKKIFSCFPYIRGGGGFGGGPFWPKGHNLSKLGRDPLGDAAYQISMLYALWFQARRFIHVFPI